MTTKFMKTKLLILVIGIAAFTCMDAAPTPKPSATPKATATATPKSTPTPKPHPKQLAMSSQAQAAIIAANITNQINSLAISAQLMTDGVPAQGNQPVVSPADIQAALGAENVRKIQAAMDALK
jgi:hypothetical protein